MTELERAPAKLTLCLHVLGTRPDGFHELEALTVSVPAPADTLALAVVSGAAPGVELDVKGQTVDVPSDGSNLVARALRVAAPDVAIRVELEKRIPAGAGLGGGSSDAAAALRWAARQQLLTQGSAYAIATSLGSDIPFCVAGRPAWMRGRGEILDPAHVGEPLRVVIITPPWQLHTPTVYRAWDELGEPTAERSVAAPTAVAEEIDVLRNDLEPAAEAVEPRSREFREALDAAAGRPALLAGSGSSYWLVADDEEHARALAARLEAVTGVAAHTAAVQLG
jgi:4-diphosphocytidyl-2-C-methyl-D-erythritol kinase